MLFGRGRSPGESVAVACLKHLRSRESLAAVATTSIMCFNASHYLAAALHTWSAPDQEEKRVALGKLWNDSLKDA